MNAKEEFLQVIKQAGNDIPICADITLQNYYDEYSDNRYTLKCKYTEEEYNSFLESLNFEYSNGFGSQNLYGTIWFEGARWAEREDYDGSEWWELRAYPTIPEELF